MPPVTADGARAREELVHELHRQEENCAYTAASFYAWMKFLKLVRVIALSGQVVFGALATWKVLTKDYALMTAVFALLAGIIGPLLSATKITDEITAANAAAAEFTALRDRFRRAALVDGQGDLAELRASAEPLFDRMDAARKLPASAPEPFFWWAQWKIRKGDFAHDYDARRSGT
jgi:hypothetical protein